MKAFIDTANSFGSERRPFFFLVDFEKNCPIILPLEELAEQNIYCALPKWSNKPKIKAPHISCNIDNAISYEEYCKQFYYAQQEIEAGNSYLLNLTAPTTLATTNTLWEIFLASTSLYSLFYRNQFTLFSPECFIRTKGEKIFSYPMKGTIDATIPDAANKLLNNDKERWEHNTIVDLIRNDLSIVAENITVNSYRFLSSIKTERGKLLQASSEICGTLNPNWMDNIGTIIDKLLPAGSISGAPKKKTCEIIAEAEGIKRSYFTGVFGIFDGKELDSGVNIRYIEKTANGLRFRSGGGLTAHSKAKAEYEEVLQKVYVPAS